MPTGDAIHRPNARAGDDPAASRVERRAAILAFSVGIALMLLKFAAYLITGSSAVFSDALESIVNVLASGFALWAISYAHQPPDQSHPYGHGKMEFVSAAIEGAMIVLAAVVIFARAMQGLIQGTAIHVSLLGVGLLAFAMVVNGAVGLYLIRAGRRGGSITLEADGHHLMSDAVTSAVVLATLAIVGTTGVNWLDPMCAILVAVYIGRLGVKLVRRAVAGLMDEQDPADHQLICDVLDAHVGPNASREPIACSYHKLRHRHSGRYHWVDFHLVVPASWDIHKAHEAASAIEGEIERMLTHTDATAHIEPCVSRECARCKHE